MTAQRMEAADERKVVKISKGNKGQEQASKPIQRPGELVRAKSKQAAW